jgi:hypothetical protein
MTADGELLQLVALATVDPARQADLLDRLVHLYKPYKIGGL